MKMLQPMTDQEINDFKDYLADVLMVWDCYEQKWLENTPIILRFENSDLIVAPKADGIRTVSFVRSDTQTLLDAFTADSDNNRTCSCWLHWNQGSNYIGEEYSVRSLLETIET